MIRLIFILFFSQLLTCVAELQGSFRVLLSPAYDSLVNATDKHTDIAKIQSEAANLRVIFTTLAQSPERDAAIRLCNIIERGAVMTKAFVEKTEKPPLKNSLASENEAKDAEARRVRYIETQWRTAITPLIAAAKVEWARIPESSAAPELTPQIEKRRIESKCKLIHGKVSQVLQDGVLLSKGTKTIFLKGMQNVIDDQYIDVVAYPDGIYRYNSVLGAQRTVEQWHYLRPLKAGETMETP